VSEKLDDFLSCGIRMSEELSFVLSHFTRVTDRRTDGHLCHRKDRVHTMQRGKKTTVRHELKLSVGCWAVVGGAWLTYTVHVHPGYA